MSDGGAAAPVVYDHVCPVCGGRADGGRGECPCDNRGLVTAAFAAEWSDVAPPVQLPPPPAEVNEPCVDCAFRGDSPEHQESSAREMLLRKVAAGRPFYCHQGMHQTARGAYVPFATDAAGEPVGHPVCAGWRRARERVLRLERKAPAPG